MREQVELEAPTVAGVRGTSETVAAEAAVHEARVRVAAMLAMRCAVCMESPESAAGAVLCKENTVAARALHLHEAL